jgi:hypothetical protein
MFISSAAAQIGDILSQSVPPVASYDNLTKYGFNKRLDFFVLREAR